MRTLRAMSPRRAAVLVAAFTTALLATACGNGSSTGDSRPSGTEAIAAWTECLRKNGVTGTPPSGGARARPSDGASTDPGGLSPSRPRPSGDASGGPPQGGPPGGGFGFGKPADVDETTWQKAQEACASVRPVGGPRTGGDSSASEEPGGGPGKGGPAGDGRNAAYQNCLRDNGVTGPGGGSASATTASKDATVRKAVEACKVLLPTASTSPSAR